jgi:hypothetical protein
MPVFAERMKDTTDHLRISIENRADVLGQVHQATNHLLHSARTFMADVSNENHERAGELHVMLTTFRGDLADRVSEMRERHRDSLGQMRDDMRQRLNDNRAARHEAVKDMRTTFQQARQEVADDVRAAAHVWHEFTITRHGKPVPKPEAETHHAAKHTAAPQHKTMTHPTKQTAGKPKPGGRVK